MLNLLPQSIIDGYVNYAKFVKTDEFKKFTPSQKAFTRRKMKLLRRIKALRCYAWNGERYDSNCVIAPLIDLFAKDEKKFSRMSTIKRKSGYMQICYDGISLLGKWLEIFKITFSFVLRYRSLIKIFIIFILMQCLLKRF